MGQVIARIQNRRCETLFEAIQFFVSVAIIKICSIYELQKTWIASKRSRNDDIVDCKLLHNDGFSARHDHLFTVNLLQRIWQRLFFLLFFFAIPTFAQTSDYTFATSTQQQQFQNLTEQLRCLVCQNESLWDSHAPLAKDLRAEIYQKITAGASEQAIKQYLVARYGEFILFKPTFNTATYALWLTPFILLLGGFIVIGWIVVRNKRD